MIVVSKPSNDSVMEPNMLDVLPPPGDCTEGQRQVAISWYVSQPMDKLGEYMGNTQQRIYREFYGNPRKQRVGKNLYHLYAMRDMLSEAMRRKGVPTHATPTGSRTPQLDAWIAERAAEESAAEKATAATNYVSLDKIDVIRASRTGTSS